MRKLKNRISAWWFYLSPDEKNIIEFFIGVAMCLALLVICLAFGYYMGKAGFE